MCGLADAFEKCAGERGDSIMTRGGDLDNDIGPSETGRSLGVVDREWKSFSPLGVP